jgi:hypothetical protein
MLALRGFFFFATSGPFLSQPNAAPDLLCDSCPPRKSKTVQKSGDLEEKYMRIAGSDANPGVLKMF